MTIQSVQPLLGRCDIKSSKVSQSLAKAYEKCACLLYLADHEGPKLNRQYLQQLVAIAVKYDEIYFWKW
jgi:hypothetical protein